MKAASRALGLLCGLWAITHGPSATASYYDLYGFTPRSTGMGGAMTAAVTDYAATFYNPGALTVAKQGHVSLVGHLRVPDLFVERQATALSADHPTVLPKFGGGASLGWAYPLGGIFEDRLALGVSLHLPAGRLVRVQGVDRLSPQFYMFQNLHDKMVFLAAAAFEPFEWLSVGAGVQVLADLSGRAELQLDIIDGRFVKREFSVDIRPTASPNIGIHLRPLPEMAIGLTWRGTSAVRFSVPVSLSEGETLSMLLDVSQTVQFTPHRVALGLAYTVPSIALTVATDAVLSLWSLAPDPSPQLRVDIGGPVLTAVGLDEALDVSVNAQPLDMGFADTVTLRLGAQWAGLSWLQLRAGYTFRPTPVPGQTGPSVYLDNDSHVISIGGGFTFTNRAIPNAFQIDVIVGYRVYVDGRPDELVRGIDLIGTPLATFSKITHAGDDMEVFNGSCGAESGWVPVSAASPSLLVAQIETQRKAKGQSKPPL
ncbi:MAG: hypothetical protein QF464_17305, partial [Myxococcota bacterium]|nr:hypothetical protein [Myxococcota bacterium]